MDSKSWTPRLLDLLEEEFPEELFLIHWVVTGAEKKRQSEKVLRKWDRRAKAESVEGRSARNNAIEVLGFGLLRQVIDDLYEIGVLPEPADELLLSHRFQNSIVVNGEGTLRDLVILEVEEGVQPSDEPIIWIGSDGLGLEPSGPQRNRYFPTTKAGARALGKFLRNRSISHWHYSSTIDFPEASGAPDLDYRGLIEKAAQGEA